MSSLFLAVVLAQTPIDAFRDLEYSNVGGISLKLDLYVPRGGTNVRS